MKCYIAVEDQDNQYSIKVDDSIAQDIYKIIMRELDKQIWVE